MPIIIDVHAHAFNAMDIPLKGYLRSRDFDGLLKFIAPRLIPAISSYIRDKLNPKSNKNALQKLAGFAALKLAYLFVGKQYSKWMDTLSKEVTEIVAEMVETFRKDSIDLYVPLMIDYKYWFRKSHDRPFKDQIELIYNNIVLPYKGKIHPFVAFDPARELAFREGVENPDEEPEQYGSLSLVKDAIEKKGFIGVKLYNAMGYRPFNNHSVEENRKRIAHHKDKYLFKGEEYDEVLSELYDYCVEKGVPITTHCRMEGSEPYHDASFDFGRAIFWRDVLEQPQYKDLHLNLAHFGWNKKHNHRGDRSWVIEICEMLGQFKNVYTDVSHHEVVNKKKRAQFKAAYQELCTDYPEIKKKLLFGIDWHVIKRVKYFEDFKDRYIEVLKSNDLFSDEEIEDFLGSNALRFLRLLPGEKNRERLADFYQKHSIIPPEWFRATA